MSQRGSQADGAEVLFEGVPAHMRGPLLYWLQGQFCNPSRGFGQIAQDSDARALRIANRVRLSLTEVRAKSKSRVADAEVLLMVERLADLAEHADDVQLLDIIDAALAERSDPAMREWSSNERRWREPNTAEDLENILHHGGSAYRVNDRGSALEQRVPAVIRMAVRHAMGNSAGSMAHLEAAWRAAYGRNPDATAAYAEAVKAIEAAFIPLVLANDPKATLGKALAYLRKTSDHWELGILDAQGAPASVDSLVSLLALIWQGHRDRHAGTSTAVRVSIEAAEMAVHAAAMIVYWLSRHGLRERGSSRS